MGTRQDFHAEHAAHREAYALRYGPPRMVEVETLYILSTYLVDVKYILLTTINTLQVPIPGKHKYSNENIDRTLNIEFFLFHLPRDLMTTLPVPTFTEMNMAPQTCAGS